VGKVSALYCVAIVGAVLFSEFPRSILGQKSELQDVASVRALLWAKASAPLWGKRQRCIVELDSALHCGARVRSVLWTSVCALLCF
jgi:hypothetical protein